MSSERWVWLSGRFTLEHEAVVPATSRSVQAGFGLYETMRVAAGRVPLLVRHLDRLESAARISGVWLGDFEWGATVAELARRNELAEGVARITLGDGFSLVTLGPLPEELETERSAGMRLPVRELRRGLPGLKSISRFDLDVIERQEYGETLLVSGDGDVLETTRASFFAVTSEGLETARPPEVLPGIGRELLLEVAAARGISVREGAPQLKDRTHWREAFTTNAVRGVRPIIDVGGHALPFADAGSLARELQSAFDIHAGWS